MNQVSKRYGREKGEATYEGYTGEVPEDQHEAVLFVEHIPCLGNTFFALGAGIHVQARGQNSESDILDRRKISIQR